MLKVEKIKPIDNDKLICELKDGSSHYISWAIPGLTFATEFCKSGLNNNATNYKDLFAKINIARETGTLYPQANMTFLPVEKANYYMGTEIHYDGEYTAEEKLSHMKDVLIANRDYIKVKRLYLDVRDLELDASYIGKMDYLDVLKELIKHRPLSIIDEIIIIYGNYCELLDVKVDSSIAKADFVQQTQDRISKIKTEYAALQNEENFY